MKGLDTGILLGLLEGSSRAREIVRKLRGSELATTEANLLELGYLAASAAPKARKARLAALERLRQRLTVIPVDSHACQEAVRHLGRPGTQPSPTAALMLGALEASGCEELLTDDPRPVGGEWRFRVRVVRL